MSNDSAMNRLLPAMLVALISVNRLPALEPPGPKRELPWGDVPIVNPDEEWWSESQAAWLGGWVGGSVGVLGAVYGVVAGLGLLRRFMLTLTLALTCLGAVSVVAGIAAVVTGQPYHVYFLPLLIGGIVTLLCGANYPALKRRYEQQELQKISTRDS